MSEALNNPEQLQKVAVAGALINKEGKVLVVKRSEKETYLPGYWELPGGKANFGEDPQNALSREFKEEVGLNVEVLDPVRVFHYVTKNDTLQTFEIVFLLSLLKDYTEETEVILSEGHDDYAFIGSEEVEEYLGTNPEVCQNVLAAFKLYSLHVQRA